MADDIATIAVAQHTHSPSADAGSTFALSQPSLTIADRAEWGIQLVSRWAGIIAFAAAIAGIGYLIF